MNKEEALEQLYRLNLDWEENGLDTKLNQTDINAIGMVISELDIANNKLKEVKEYLKNEDHNQEIDDFGYYKHTKNILSIIGGE